MRRIQVALVALLVTGIAQAQELVEKTEAELAAERHEGTIRALRENMPFAQKLMYDAQISMHFEHVIGHAVAIAPTANAGDFSFYQVVGGHVNNTGGMGKLTLYVAAGALYMGWPVREIEYNAIDHSWTLWYYYFENETPEKKERRSEMVELWWPCASAFVQRERSTP